LRGKSTTLLKIAYVRGWCDTFFVREVIQMNELLAAEFVAILDRFEAREINAEEALIEIQIAVAKDNER
jgi:hypothetical protein